MKHKPYVCEETLLLALCLKEEKDPTLAGWTPSSFIPRENF